ncbi:MAG: hypothetical protein SGCHY_004102 [Lobulomycetales sp.]
MAFALAVTGSCSFRINDAIGKFPAAKAAASLSQSLSPATETAAHLPTPVSDALHLPTPVSSTHHLPPDTPAPEAGGSAFAVVTTLSLAVLRSPVLLTHALSSIDAVVLCYSAKDPFSFAQIPMIGERRVSQKTAAKTARAFGAGWSEVIFGSRNNVEDIASESMHDFLADLYSRLWHERQILRDRAEMLGITASPDPLSAAAAPACHSHAYLAKHTPASTDLSVHTSSPSAYISLDDDPEDCDGASAHPTLDNASAHPSLDTSLANLQVGHVPSNETASTSPLKDSEDDKAKCLAIEARKRRYSMQKKRISWRGSSDDDDLSRLSNVSHVNNGNVLDLNNDSLNISDMNGDSRNISDVNGDSKEVSDVNNGDSRNVLDLNNDLNRNETYESNADDKENIHPLEKQFIPSNPPHYSTSVNSVKSPISPRTTSLKGKGNNVERGHGLDEDTIDKPSTSNPTPSVDGVTYIPARRESLKYKRQDIEYIKKDNHRPLYSGSIGRRFSGTPHLDLSRSPSGISLFPKKRPVSFDLKRKSYPENKQRAAYVRAQEATNFKRILDDYSCSQQRPSVYLPNAEEGAPADRDFQFSATAQETPLGQFSSLPDRIPRKSYSIQDLIVQMTHPQMCDPEFTQVFLMLYPRWMVPADLWNALVQRFEYAEMGRDSGQAAVPVQLRVCNVLIMWMKEYWHQDFQFNEALKFGCLLFLRKLDELGPAFRFASRKIARILFAEKEVPAFALVNGGVRFSSTARAKEEPARGSFDWAITGTFARRLDRSVTTTTISTTTFERKVTLEDPGVVVRPLSAPVHSLDSLDLSDVDICTLPPLPKPIGTCSEDSNREKAGARGSGSGSSCLGEEHDDEHSDDDKDIQSQEEMDDLPSLSHQHQSSFQSSAGLQSSPKTESGASITSVERGLLSLFSRRGGESSVISNGSLKSVTESLVRQRISANLSIRLEFLDIEPKEIARQLDLIEFEIFEKIKPRDLLHHLWDRYSKGRHAPLVYCSIKHFNFLSLWVQSVILDHKKLKDRSKALLNMLKVALHLRESNNFNSLMAVLCGINCTPVLRLKQTWKLVDGKKATKEFLKIEKLMRAEKSFEVYRRALKSSGMPCVPYLGVVLKDLLFIEDSNKDYRPDGALNLAKFLLIGDIILMVQSFQRKSYAHVRNDSVCDMIYRQELHSEAVLFDMSLEREPRTKDS